jgi:putative drug exporter of the RND superfamily
VVARVARWCVEHRRRVLIAWLVLPVAALGVSSAVGTRPANEFSLKGTESQLAWTRAIGQVAARGRATSGR